jgi:hypothetical protein
MSAGDPVSAAGACSNRSAQTFSQFGLDADDAFFGRYARALLECESLAALRATRPSQNRPAHLQRPPFRVAIARNATTGADTVHAAKQIGPTAFDVDTPLPGQTSIPDASGRALSAPESGPWFVRMVLPGRDSAGASASSCDADDDTVQPAICVSVPTRTLTRNALLDSWFATVLLWMLPAATVVFYCLASLPSPFVSGVQSNVVFVCAFFACGLLAIALIFSRIETSILLKRLLYTFDAVYLIAWMLVFLGASIIQIPFEIDTRSSKLGMNSDQYIFFCAASFFCMTLAFLVVLFSDALIHISRWFKIYVRFKT